MRHFQQKAIARRYALYRPQVQSGIVALVAKELSWTKPFSYAVDYACGTGHSTFPLTAYATKVVGCDISAEMLEQARQAYPGIDFIRLESDVLPFTDDSVDLLTVGFAFHWLSAPSFLPEAARVLKKGGLLLIYNMFFPGIMKGNDAYQAWHQKTYTAKYPSPKRNRQALKTSLEKGDFTLTLERVISLSFPQTLSALELRNYLTSQSNISLALEKGDSLSAVDEWLDASIAPYFSRDKEAFDYRGQCAVVRQG